MLKVREKRVKQKFDWSDKILEYSIRRVGIEIGKGKEEYCQAPFMSQLLSVNTNMHNCMVFSPTTFCSFNMEVEVLWLDSVRVWF